MKEIEKIKKLISKADYILVGAGSGLSTAAGNTYTGERFTKNFKPFIEKYHFTDLYTSSFYDFKTEEERWAYWSKHIYIANIGLPELPLYKQLYNFLEKSKKEYFIITTNVDDCFYKVGFDPNKVLTPIKFLGLKEVIKYYNVNMDVTKAYMTAPKKSLK